MLSGRCAVSQLGDWWQVPQRQMPCCLAVGHAIDVLIVFVLTVAEHVQLIAETIWYQP